MSQRQYKVLIADDVRLELEIEKTFLQRSGFNVLTATDGPSVIAMVSQTPVDIIVLDQFMQGLTGSQVCTILKGRAETRLIPVIITSANSAREVQETCRTAGAESFVAKAAGPEALMRAIAQTLRVPQRKVMRLTVMFQIEGLSGGRETLGKATDLSEGGLCLEVNRRYSIGDTFNLRFHLPGERQEVRVDGRVMRISEHAEGIFRAGVQFTRLGDDDRKKLNAYIDKSLSGK